MLWILIVGVSMAVLSAIFWMIEVTPFVNAIKKLDYPNNPISGITYTLKMMSLLPKLLPFIIDICATIWLSGAFGFSGMIGGIIGLSISNVISVFLILKFKPKPRSKQ